MSNLPVTQPVVFVIPNGSGTDDTITVDAAPKEQHALVNTLTSNPVEKGAPITDHSRPEPRVLTLDCVVTNTPFNAVPDDYANALWSRFVQLWQSPVLLSVLTSRDYYQNMGITNVTNPVDSKTAQGLVFTITLREVRIVFNQFTSVVKSNKPKAKKNVKAGQSTTQEPAAPVQQTLAKKIIAAVKGA